MVGQFQQDILLKLVTNFKQAQKDLKRLKGGLSGLSGAAQTKSITAADEKVKNLTSRLMSLNKLRPGVLQNFPSVEKKINRVAMASQNLGTKIKQNSKFWTKQEKFSRGFFKNIDTFSNKIIPESVRNMSRFEAITRKSQGVFQGWALSLMFAGMALMRMFNQITRFGVTAFNEISHSLEGTTTQFDLLQGGMKELGFLVGQALEPLVQFLLPIVDRVSEWVAKNPELVRTLVIILGVLGSVLTVLGMSVLAIQNGLIPFAKILAGLFTKVIGPAIGGLASTLGVGILPLLGWIAAIAAVIWAAWKTNFGNIQGFVKKVFTAIGKFIKRVFEGLKQIFKGVFQVLEGLFSGDMDKVMLGLVNIVLGAVKIILSAFGLVGDLVISVFEFAVNIVKDAIFSLIKLIVSSVKFLTRFIDEIFGSDTTAKVDQAIAGITRAQEALTLDFGGKGLSGVTDSIIDKLDELTVQVEVNLDGDKVAESTATRINQSATTGGN